ncbi:Nucleoside diphosphate kinase 6 [Thelohanellus kitauei]|uniref:Nucleoside diphosphate kinase 6 n=1 Tax=Thelohanellus kitauei TaxID=669202 RepID=A0A0C2JYT4_THEKT|nr:Nucleoside diphosphate kinase 6 [Thelohanellus kitauei]
MVHENAFFYDRLVRFVASGPVVPMVLSRDQAVDRFRRILGPTKFTIAQRYHPDTLRGMFGTSDVCNVAHGSDNDEKALQEVQFFFPELKSEIEDKSIHTYSYCSS